MIKLSMALTAFFTLGLAQLTFAADQAQALKAGLYQTDSQFCSQVLSWDGPTLVLMAIDGCDAKIVLNEVAAGVYNGKIQGYDYDYRVTVKDLEHYTFESLYFGTAGDFSYVGAGKPVHNLETSGSIDPTQR